MSYSPYHPTIYLDTLKVQMISIETRRDCAENFCMNNDMTVEWKLLDAQLKALELEYDRIQSDL